MVLFIAETSARGNNVQVFQELSGTVRGRVRRVRRKAGRAGSPAMQSTKPEDRPPHRCAAIITIQLRRVIEIVVPDEIHWRYLAVFLAMSAT
jgi:hypothetical protein